MEPLGAFTAREREDEAGKRNRGRESVVKSERASERASKKKKKPRSMYARHFFVCCPQEKKKWPAENFPFPAALVLPKAT